MKRLSLINAIFEATDFKTYLEIGCYRGRTFFNVNAESKIGVDPKFHRLFYVDFIRKDIFKSKFFKMTSNAFFAKYTSFLTKKSPIDVALIDGLHTFKASLTDVFNTLPYLGDKGTIILHDCNPPNAGAAMPTMNFPTKEEQNSCSDWSGAWCGDVWKTIVYLRKYHSDQLEVRVVDTDSGLGIVYFKNNVLKKKLNIEEEKFVSIDALTYADLVKDKASLLNLETVQNFKPILQQRYPEIKL